MKEVYLVYKIESKTILVPSKDYYARSDDFSKDDIDFLSFNESFTTKEKAIDYIKEIEPNDYSKGTYVILNGYTVE